MKKVCQSNSILNVNSCSNKPAKLRTEYNLQEYF